MTGPLLVQVQLGTGDLRNEVLTGATLVGRDLAAYVISTDLDRLLVADEFVSPSHCRLWPEDGSWWVEDAGSTNGTWLFTPSAPEPMYAASRVLAPVRLRKGWQLRVGHARLTVVPVTA
jgi:predicted component of type VI protein secretion system